MEGLTGPRCGRPSDPFDPPTALFNPDPTLLNYDLEHPEAFGPNSADADHAFDPIESAVNVFDEEGEREAGLCSILGGLLAGKMQCQVPIANGTTKPYGVRLEELLAYLIVKVKNKSAPSSAPDDTFSLR